MGKLRILITGCLHGEWDLLCDTVEQLIEEGNEIDMIIVTGDAQTMRFEEDLKSFAAPAHYRRLGTFYKLYNGERRIARPTIVLGGNHESSDFLHLLPFGGWLAQNVFYTGRANSLKVGDVSITAISGLYNSHYYYENVDEKYPIRSKTDLHKCFHIRAFSDFQILGLERTQIMLSHDWPSGIPRTYGGKYLQRRKKCIVESDENNNFGLHKGIEILKKLKPSSWYASHHHITFNAKIEGTTFYANPKIGMRNWYVITEVENNSEILPFKYRGEWLSILKATSSEMSDPNILKKCDWEERWKSIKPQMEHFEDCPVGPLEMNPYEYTARFCTEHNIFCPNQEIREFIEKKKNH